MAKISEFVEEYQQTALTKNIADLKEVSIDLEIMDDEFEFMDDVTKQTKVVKQKVIVVDNEKYRVPVSAIQQLKIILKDNPSIKKFKVMKSGTTKADTRYQVIPLT